MGSCACQQSNSDWLGQEICKIPEPSIFRSESFLCLNYNGAANHYSNFEDFKQSISDYMVLQVSKLAVFNAEGSLNKTIVYLACTDNVIVRTNVLVEISEDKLIVQITKPQVTNLFLSSQKKRIVVQYKPNITGFNKNMVLVIEGLYNAKLEDKKEVASTKNIMKFIKELIK